MSQYKTHGQSMMDALLKVMTGRGQIGPLSMEKPKKPKKQPKFKKAPKRRN